jgi:UDP-GlcNAc:undecaprenyl-phosphate GlcNAc-1-phosphate transferase
VTSFIAAFAVAAAVCALLTPLAARLGLRLGVVSNPGGRHVHERPTPRTGGVALTVAFFAPLIALFFVESSVATTFRSEPWKAAGLIIGGLLMSGVGFIDDARGLRALHKLYAQVIVAGIAFACGFRIEAILLPAVGTISMGIFAAPVTVLWIVGLINAVNLIDGLDGLAAGVIFCAAVTNFFVGWVTASTFVCLLMAATGGAVFGFYFYNRNPARVFMGDSGSYLFGYVLAVASLTGASQKASTTVALLVPIVALGVPIFDTLFAMVRRMLERRPIFSPDRGHIHHRLLDMGITHRRAVLILYGVCVLCAVLAIAMTLDRSWLAGVALVCASVVLVFFVKFFGYFQYLDPKGRHEARARARESERLRYVLPKAPRALEEARSEEELFAALGKLAAEADLDFIDVIELPGRAASGSESTSATESSTSVWSRAGDKPRPDTVSARYALGKDASARAELRFGWQSLFGAVSPQTDILLQVITDIVATQLTRLGSRLAPEPPPVSAEEAAAEAARPLLSSP